MPEIDYIEKTELEILQGLSNCIANLQNQINLLQYNISEIKKTVYGGEK